MCSVHHRNLVVCHRNHRLIPFILSCSGKDLRIFFPFYFDLFLLDFFVFVFTAAAIFDEEKDEDDRNRHDYVGSDCKD